MQMGLHMIFFFQGFAIEGFHYNIQYMCMQVNLIVNPGRPGSPITGEQTDQDVARSAALGLWSCSKSRSNKIVRQVKCHIYNFWM